jgi:alkylation response protein AidB-like acyl-CoA dehydrogenase
MLAESDEFRQQVIRHDDYTLSAEQELLRDTYARMLADHSPLDRVRAVEHLPGRFDHELWSVMTQLGAASAGMGFRPGADSAGLVDHVIVAEQVGAAAAATPFIECAVLGRLSEGLGSARRTLLQRLLSEPQSITSVGLHPGAAGMRQLVPCGTVAAHVVGLVDGKLLVCAGRRGDSPENIAGAPLAWWELDPTDAVELTSGRLATRLFAKVVAEWKLLTAAAVLGLATAALNDAVRYAKQREAFGAPIGAFQAISHPLADVAVRLTATRRLILRAAWFTDHDPDSAPELVPMAVVVASEVATRAAAISVHVQGGYGVTLDSGAQMYFRRLKGWPLLGGDPAREIRSIADHVRHHAARETAGARPRHHTPND